MITLSFIIPALNEEQHIGDTIDQIVKNTGATWQYEIIVVDNGSKDNTVNIAKRKGAKTLSFPNVPVSVLRNRGSLESSGDILVFIDGDVGVTSQWGGELNTAINQLYKDPMQITGSICGITEQPGWLERHWFDPTLRRKAPSYINSGHLIVSRRLFEAVKGFDENLETGEDVDFCEKSYNQGAQIVLNPKLSVIHKGYPTKLLNFFQRERWHARGDYSSTNKIRSSKPALVSLFLLFTLLCSLIISLLTWQALPLILYLGIFVGVCLFSSIHRFGIFGFQWITGGLIYAVYFMARGLSFIEVLFLKK